MAILTTWTTSSTSRKPVSFLLHALFIPHLIDHLQGKRKDKTKDLPEALQAQWEQDRLKKAEHKRERAAERLQLAADPLFPKKGGKKGRKAMLRTAKLDATITVVPNRVIDMTTLVRQIRRFLADLGGPRSMALPPTNKETRKKMHHMALAFGLKSESKGKGEARYTTLFKTTRSGVGVDERKVAEVMRWGERSGGGSFGGGRDNDGGKGKGRGGVPKHKEGDEVGKVVFLFLVLVQVKLIPVLV